MINLFPQICLICTQSIDKKKISYIHTLWNDELYEGLPICDHCYCELYGKIKGKYLDYDIREDNSKPKLRGIEKWL